MIQFNLLPDVKLQYLKAERTRRIVISTSILITIVALIATGLLFSLTIARGRNIDTLNRNIQIQGSKLNNQKNLDQILTIQNQISTLQSLHMQEPATDRLAGFLYQLIPLNANISSFNINFDTNNVTMSGTANTLVTVNQLVDTLKYAKYSVKGTPGESLAFSQVVLTNFGVNQGSASYSVSFNFNPTIFNNTDNVSLIIPNKVSTRSQLDQPTQLFKIPPSTKNVTNSTNINGASKP